MRVLSAIFMISCFLLGGCYHQVIEQGNIISSDKTAQIKPGMSKQAVVNILGNPVLENMYRDDRLVYVYTIQPTRSRIEKSQFIVTFRNGTVLNTTH